MIDKTKVPYNLAKDNFSGNRFSRVYEKLIFDYDGNEPHARIDYGFFSLSDGSLSDGLQLVCFKDCDFNVNVDINEIDLHCLLNFENCTFYKPVIFSFGIDTLILKDFCIFKEKFQFFSIVKKYAVFRDVIFEREFHFNSTSVIDKKFEFSKCEFKYDSLFRHLNFGNDILFDKSNLTNCSFLNSNIYDVRFNNCKFDYNNLIDEKYSKLKKNIEIEDVISTYRNFEINFDKNKDYEQAGEFHKRRYELDLLISKKYSLKKFLLLLYKWSSNFGENYGRSFNWFVLALIAFSFIYLFTGLVYKNSNYDTVIYYFKNENRFDFWNDLGSSFLYSLNNALPFRRELEFIKSANGWTTFFSILETFFETILATLFIIGLRRKFKR